MCEERQCLIDRREHDQTSQSNGKDALLQIIIGKNHINPHIRAVWSKSSISLKFYEIYI